jgi:hypothetical protein
MEIGSISSLSLATVLQRNSFESQIVGHSIAQVKQTLNSLTVSSPIALQNKVINVSLGGKVDASRLIVETNRQNGIGRNIDITV